MPGSQGRIQKCVFSLTHSSAPWSSFTEPVCVYMSSAMECLHVFAEGTLPFPSDSGPWVEVWGRAYRIVGEDPTFQAWPAPGMLSSQRGEDCDSRILRTLKEGKTHWKRGFPQLLLLSTQESMCTLSTHSQLSRPWDLESSFISYLTKSLLTAHRQQEGRSWNDSFSPWASEGNPVLSAWLPPPTPRPQIPTPNVQAFPTVVSASSPLLCKPSPPPTPAHPIKLLNKVPKAATFRRKQKNMFILRELTA